MIALTNAAIGIARIFLPPLCSRYARSHPDDAYKVIRRFPFAFPTGA